MTRVPRWAFLCVLASVASCSVVAPADDAPVTALLLDQVPSDLPHVPARAITLRVEVPEARPLYDTTEMAYSLRAHQLAYYGRNQWAETPSQMLLPLLVRTLQATGGLATVTTLPGPEPAFTLHTQITQLLQDYTREPPRARVALRVVLRDPSGRTLAQRDVDEEQVMQAKNPYAGVLAANAALARALAELARFVVQALP